MSRADDAATAKARAEALFKRREEFETGLKLWSLAAEASKAEATEKIAKLRALRLAKEATINGEQ